MRHTVVPWEVVPRGVLVRTCRYGGYYGLVNSTISCRKRISVLTRCEFRNLQHESLNPTLCRIEYISWLNESFCQVGNDSLQPFIKQKWSKNNSVRFKANGLKGLLTRFGEQKYSFPNFGKNLFHFKTKYLKPCSGFKLNTYKVLSFLQKCVKGCPTVVQL